MRPDAVATMVLSVLVGLFSWPTVTADVSLGETAERLKSCKISEDLVRSVSGISIDVGGAFVWLDDGVIFPLTPPGGVAREIVFRGKGRLSYKPAREVERSQLILFADKEALDESFSQAVLAVGGPAVAAAVSGGAQVPDLDPTELAKAGETACGWRERPEYELFGVSRGLLLAELGEPDYGLFFAAWVATAEHGDILLVHDPEQREGLGIGRYDIARSSPPTQGRRRKHQPDSDFFGSKLGDGAAWNWWTRDTALGMSGKRPYTEEHLALEIWLTGSDLEMRATARIRLKVQRNQRRTVLLNLPEVFEVDAVRSATGAPIDYHFDRSRLLVRLDAPAEAGAMVELEIDYHGAYLESDGRGYFSDANDTTLSWYPRIGDRGRPTIDAVFHWPKELELFASGQRSADQEDGGTRSARFLTDIRGVGMAFEVGEFRVAEFEFGERELVIAVPSVGCDWLTQKNVTVLANNFDEILTFEEKLFGDLPVDRISIVVTRRFFSQATWSMITLSDSALRTGVSYAGGLLGLNYRNLLAHEIAHLWWGNLIGWDGYRDQWISEAMAEYVAGTWGRLSSERDGKHWIAPWTMEQLSLDDYHGRSVLTHQAGPVTLGRRLISSTCSDCYVPIVYGKGPMILSSLETLVGEQRWYASIQEISRWARHKTLTTSLLIRAFEKTLDMDLEPFSSSFIYRAGFPQIGFEHSTTAQEDGKFLVEINAVHQASKRRRYRIRVSSQGEFDLRQEWSNDYDARASELAVPVRVVTKITRVGDTSQIQRASPLTSREAILIYEIEKAKRIYEGEELVLQLIDGRGSLTLETELEPLSVLMNHKQTALAEVTCWSCYPKQTLAHRAFSAARRGDAEEARRLAHLTFSTDAAPVDEDRHYRNAIVSRRRRWWDGLAHLSLATVALDHEELDEAKTHLKRAGRLLVLDPPRWLTNLKHRIDTRRSLLRGNHRKAYNTLWRRVLNGDDESLEGFFLLAIASIQIEEERTLEKIEPVFAWSGYDLDRIRSLMEQAQAED